VLIAAVVRRVPNRLPLTEDFAGELLGAVTGRG
jgi:hypothetical protein